MEQQGAEMNAGETVVDVATRLPAFGHLPFSGHYRTRLEGNGRIVLPSALRSPFLAVATTHVLRRDRALWLLTPRAFDLMVDAMHSTESRGIVDPKSRGRLYMAAPRVSVDKQGRLVIPPELRERVGLQGEAEVELAGAIEHVELWPADLWDAEQAARLDDADLLFEGFEGLPTGPA
jgi:DNA-binding transcriptional regulator/RsmH inhibitor MraZ